VTQAELDLWKRTLVKVMEELLRLTLENKELRER
jgi:regulator of replication initiation timing